MQPIFLTARWEHLLMINYAVDPDVVAPFVPQGTEIDFWNGQTFISLVGFRFLDTKVKGWPIPFHRHFDEVNLRFYIKRTEGSEIKRAVGFIKEIVPKWAIAAVARWKYNEPYVALPMQSSVRIPTANESGQLEYGWSDASEQYSMAANIAGPPQPLTPNSEAEFIAEHYWGYTRQKDNSTIEYQVEHPPWRVWEATDPVVRGDLVRFYGESFADALRAQPSSCFVAEGSPIVVRQGRTIPIQDSV
ncbi:MAG: DUF2071 domain-containing protein [Planctomycetales bacterium]|nr:DUF2071 domain-containing protein [Planctomycetales bacterium]